MMKWIVHLTETVSEAVALSLRFPGGLTEHSQLSGEITQQRMANDRDAFAQLISHLLADIQPPFWASVCQ